MNTSIISTVSLIIAILTRLAGFFTASAAGIWSLLIWVFAPKEEMSIAFFNSRIRKACKE